MTSKFYGVIMRISMIIGLLTVVCMIITDFLSAEFYISCISFVICLGVFIASLIIFRRKIKNEDL